ncbi:MAG: EtfB protein [Rhodospirillaceae bacterium]|nr:EtfB protein [Rhodospirillaceae bacterium]
MKILIPLKRVIDYNVRVRINPDGSGVVRDGVKMSINPFDEIALEEALRIKERGEATEIIVITIGTQENQQQLRTGLAMGADRAILIETSEELEPLTIARALKVLIDREDPQLVIMGKQAIDSDNNQTGQMLAGLWNRPQATFVSELTLSEGTATAVREVDAGLEVIKVKLPAVITSDLRLNEPRYVKLPEIMKAKKKPLDTIPFSELGMTPETQFSIVSIETPPKRPKGIMVENVSELAKALQDRGLI